MIVQCRGPPVASRLKSVLPTTGSAVPLAKSSVLCERIRVARRERDAGRDRAGARRRQVEQVELEDVRDAELLADQILQVLERLRRRGGRELDRVGAGRVRVLGPELPLVDRRGRVGAVVVGDEHLDAVVLRRAGRVRTDRLEDVAGDRRAAARACAGQEGAGGDGQVGLRADELLRGPDDRVGLDRRDRTAVQRRVVGEDLDVEALRVAAVRILRAVDLGERRPAQLVDRLLQRLDLADELLRRDPDQRDLLVGLARGDLVDLLDELVADPPGQADGSRDLAADR